MHLLDHINPFIVAVISGKGGVGKSISTVNMATMLNDMGYKVAIIDADLGLSNCATMFNKTVPFNVCHWILNRCSLEDTIQDINGITLVTGANDPTDLKIDTGIIMDALDQIVHSLSSNHDFILIDTPAGAGEMSLWALDTAKLGLCVLVDEPTAISDAYRLIKYVLSIDPDYDFGSIVNFAEHEEDALSTIERFNTILSHFLQRECTYLGFIPDHAYVRNTVKKQTTLLGMNPENPINNEMEFIVQNIISTSNTLEQSQPQLAYFNL
jgi:flagellar biosynthesis protein FlhG